MYKIYFNNKPLFLVSDTSAVDEYLHREDTMFIDDFDSHTVKTMIHEMDQPKVQAGVFLHSDIDELLHAFKKKLTLIQAAGGLVRAGKKDVLMIYRRGKWDLPKGKLDENESVETCAVREVMEETGLQNVHLERFLCTTFHTYTENRQHILKETNWYLMKAPKQTLNPQTEEDIEKCIWVKEDQLAPYLDHTYALIKEVFQAAGLLGQK